MFTACGMGWPAGDSPESHTIRPASGYAEKTYVPFGKSVSYVFFNYTTYKGAISYYILKTCVLLLQATTPAGQRPVLAGADMPRAACIMSCIPCAAAWVKSPWSPPKIPVKEAVCSGARCSLQ